MASERSIVWKCLHGIAWLICRLFFNLKVYGRRHVPAHGGVLIVSNHQSNLDPVLLGCRINRPLSYIAKSELFHGRVSKWLLLWFNAFPVRQGKGDVHAIKETIHRLQDGHVLNIFPEGSRTPDGEILPLQRGVGLIVKRARVPVIPAVIVGSFQAWPMHRAFFTPGPVRVRFGREIELTGLTTDQEITDAIERELRRMFAQLQRHAKIKTRQSPMRLATAVR